MGKKTKAALDICFRRLSKAEEKIRDQTKLIDNLRARVVCLEFRPSDRAEPEHQPEIQEPKPVPFDFFGPLQRNPLDARQGSAHDGLGMFSAENPFIRTRQYDRCYELARLVVTSEDEELRKTWSAELEEELAGLSLPEKERFRQILSPQDEDSD